MCRRQQRFLMAGVLVGVYLTAPRVAGQLSDQECVTAAEALLARRHVAADPTRTAAMALGISTVDTIPLGRLAAAEGRLVVVKESGLGGDELMCYRSPEEFFVVEGPHSLAGRVRIGSRASALRYARLFTSPGTFNCFPTPWWVELVPAGTVTRGYLFGRDEPRSAKELRTGWFHGGELGVLHRDEWLRCGLERPKVYRLARGYAVVRTLCCGWNVGPGIAPPTRVCQVREAISPEGQLDRQELREFDVPVNIWVWTRDY